MKRGSGKTILFLVPGCSFRITCSLPSLFPTGSSEHQAPLRQKAPKASPKTPQERMFARSRLFIDCSFSSWLAVRSRFRAPCARHFPSTSGALEANRRGRWHLCVHAPHQSTPHASGRLRGHCLQKEASATSAALREVWALRGGGPGALSGAGWLGGPAGGRGWGPGARGPKTAETVKAEGENRVAGARNP